MTTISSEAEDTVEVKVYEESDIVCDKSDRKNVTEENLAELDSRFSRRPTDLPTLTSNSKLQERKTVDGPFQFKRFREVLDETVENAIPKYNMNHKNRGMAVIFNHEHFDPAVRMNRRVGTDKDVTNLNKHLGRLGFEIKVFHDLGVMDLRKVLFQVSQLDHTDSDCFLCIFLTHGDDGVLYGRDGTTEIQELFDLFRGDKCPSLVGKPKIFLIQACRGDQHEIGMIEADSVDQTDARGSIVTSDLGGATTVPSGADFLLSYSVVQGYYSHRDTAFGSWYVQALSRVLENHGTTMDFTQILTIVNQLVAQRAVERCLDPRMVGKKQIPCFMSMLTKQLVFVRKTR